VPALASAEIAEHRGGLPTLAADGHFIADRMPGFTNFYALGACCVGGLSVSPAFGELMADWICRGQPTEDVSALASRPLLT
jgi:glycine/D-amino acid oxidase-like deaminating enzyme